MWYNTIPNISISPWLADVLGLFSSTLSAVLGLPALAFFVGVLLFLLAAGLFSFLVRKSRRGK